MTDFIPTLFGILIAALLFLCTIRVLVSSLDLPPDTTLSKFLQATSRIISGLAGLPAIVLTVFFSRGIVNQGVNLLTLAWAACPGMAAGLLIWFALRGDSEHEVKMIQSGWKWGVIVGVVGFILGFIIVPVVASFITGRDQPQGPLLGIFVTGPLGFPIGVVIGVLIKVWRHPIL